MKILALERELTGATAEQFHQYAIAEARKVWDLTQAGIIREIYFRADRNESVLILERGSVAEAEETLAELPFMQNKLIAFDLISLKAYPGFERLFVKD
jgi:hypothetical protein